MLVSVIHTPDAKKLHRELTRAEKMASSNGHGRKEQGIQLGELYKIFGRPKMAKPPGDK